MTPVAGKPRCQNVNLDIAGEEKHGEFDGRLTLEHVC